MDALTYLFLKGFEGKNNGKKNIFLANMIRESMLEDQVAELDANLEIAGNNQLDAIKIASNFEDVKRNLGYLLARYGEMYGLILIKAQPTSIISVAKIASVEKVGGKLTEAVVYASTLQKNGEPYDNVVYRYFFGEDGYVYKVNGIWENNSFIANKMAIVQFVGDEIPLREFKNNFLGNGLVPLWAEPLLEAIDTLGDEFLEEWYNTRQSWLKNMLIDNRQSGKEFANAIRNSRVHEVRDPDGNLGGTVGGLASGSPTITDLINLTSFLEDKLYKTLHKQRDMINGKQAQVNNLEAAKTDAQSFNHLIDLNKYRLNQYKEFFEMVSKQLNIPITVVLPLPPLEDYRAKMLIADLEVKRGQAASQLATAAEPQPQEETQPEEE